MGNRKPCVGNIQLRPKGRTGGVFMGPFGFYCVRDAGRGPSNITAVNPLYLAKLAFWT